MGLPTGKFGNGTEFGARSAALATPGSPSGSAAPAAAAVAVASPAFNIVRRVYIAPSFLVPQYLCRPTVLPRQAVGAGGGSCPWARICCKPGFGSDGAANVGGVANAATLGSMKSARVVALASR